MERDKFFLTQAIALARRNVDQGHGGPFGALVVREDRVIGEGWNQVVLLNDPTAHAEVQAIRAACQAVSAFHLPGATLYASSEPCPLCLSAIYWARIARVVFANTREEAAAIGFCDDQIYEELCRPLPERLIRMDHLPLPGADEPLRCWHGNPARTCY